ncbi:hypothetical protein U27_05899 [Candidatus Vecturithrix granuli]|uniref:DUF454 domain-containing protein n=1 Tax=Vecturithrix granuli TaxID=1499967 RepID=A0A081C2W9_VECG1|nr:hypothetical protein U27_05899 [Candidatus Vecturithrix granuli]
MFFLFVSFRVFRGPILFFMRFSEQFKKWILIFVGSLSVGLAFAGIFLPLLPTTPFLLLAAACYIRSSDRFYHWLIYHKWFGSYIRNYREGRGIPLITKITAIMLLWLTIGYSVLFAVSALFLKFILIGIALGVTIHLLKTKTLNLQETPVSSPIRKSAED